MSREKKSFIRKLFGWICFIGFYVGEVVKSNLYILWDVVTPGHLANPCIIALKIPEEMTDTQVLIVSNLITMTPGTLSLELTEDRATLLIHILYTGDLDQTRYHLTQNYVHRVLSLS